MTRQARKMEQYKDWYQFHQNKVKKLFRKDAELFTSFLAATSQNCSIRTNVALALKAYEQYKNKQNFDGFLPQVRQNLQRIVAGSPCAGPKIRAFERAMHGDPDAIVVDLHMTELFFSRKTPAPRQRRAIEQEVARVAKRLNWEPRQAQAALWAYNHTKRGNAVPSYDLYL